MKTWRYVLSLLGMVSILSVQAQGFAQMPTTPFRSTSTMVNSGSAYSATPMLNRDGTAAYSCSSPVGGPLRAKKDGNPFDNGSGGTVNIGEVVNPNEPGTPLGDALIPLALMALAFDAVVAVRRRRSAEKN